MVAVSWVAEMYVVERLAPFHWTTEPDTKPVPEMVSVNEAPPALAVAGLAPVVVGTGLLAETVKETVATLLVFVPSLAVYVKLSLPT